MDDIDQRARQSLKRMIRETQGDRTKVGPTPRRHEVRLARLDAVRRWQATDAGRRFAETFCPTIPERPVKPFTLPTLQAITQVVRTEPRRGKNVKRWRKPSPEVTLGVLVPAWLVLLGALLPTLAPAAFGIPS